MDFDDTPEEAAFRAECRKWLEAHATLRTGGRSLGVLADADPEAEAEHIRVAKAWQATLEEAGWAGITWPAAYGGRGGTPRQQAIFDQEQAFFDVPVSVFSQGIAMAGPTIIEHGTEEQQERFLRPMLRGDEIWCQLFSEPAAGSDLAAVATRAERDGDMFVVNGQKVWTSSAQFSDWGILLARTNLDVPKHQGITYFLVDMRSPGIEVRPLRQITGVAHFNEVFLTDVRIPVAHVLGEVDGGWRVAMTTLMHERAMISGAGGGEDVAAALVQLAHGTGAWDQPAIRQAVMRAFIHNRLLTYLGWRAKTVIDQGGVPGPEGSVLKLRHSLHQAEVGDLAMALLGAAGTLLDYDDLDSARWQARFLTQWASRIGGGTEQVQRNIIGDRVLGLPREPNVDRDVPFRAVRKSPVEDGRLGIGDPAR